MKQVRKMLALNLVLVMLLTTLIPSVMAAAAEAIKLGETVGGIGNGETYVFTPEEDGTYLFDFYPLAVEATCPHLSLYESNKWIGGESRYYNLSADKTYRIEVRGGGVWNTGTNHFSLKITKTGLPDGEESRVDVVITEVGVAEYFEVRDFSEGLAAVERKEWRHGIDNYDWGFIDKTGQVVIPCRYGEVKSFSEGLAAVCRGSLWGFIDKTGQEIIPQKYSEVGVISENLIAVCLDGQWGFIDKTGQEVVSCRYEEVRDFSEGRAAVCLNDKWGFIDKTGQEVISCQYEETRDFSEDLAAVYSDDKWGFIDKTGQMVISCEYTGVQKITGFTNGVALINGYDDSRRLTYGTGAYAAYVNKDGKTEIMYGVVSCEPPVDGISLVSSKDYDWNAGTNYYSSTYRKWGGGVPKGFQSYYDAKSFSEGRAAIQPYSSVDKSRGASSYWGFIDENGDEIIPHKYNEVRSFSQGYAAVCLDGNWGVIDKDGREIVPCEYNKIGDLSDNMVWVWSFNRDKVRLLSVVIGGGSTAPIPATGTAYASTQTVDVDGKAVLFECYALKDAKGNPTNYIKLRDIASVLNHTSAQFQVGWDNKKGVTITTGQEYISNGSEMSTPFSGDRSYEVPAAQTWVDGEVANLEAIVLTNDRGGQYTYYKLRDLGAALGFKVEWSSQQGICIKTK